MMQPSEMRELRKNAGISQGELAEQLGMALDTVGRMERGLPGYPIERRTEMAIRVVVAAYLGKQLPGSDAFIFDRLMKDLGYRPLDPIA